MSSRLDGKSNNGRRDRTSNKSEVTSDVEKVLRMIDKGFYLSNDFKVLRHDGGGYIETSKRVQNFFYKKPEYAITMRVRYDQMLSDLGISSQEFAELAGVGHSIIRDAFKSEVYPPFIKIALSIHEGTY